MTALRHVPRRKTMLVILDGFGLNPSKKNNAVYEARTPRLDEYFARFAHGAIQASGRAVGLPNGQMGNSEVGHLTLGCGAILRQSLVRIGDAVADGSYFQNTVLLDALAAAKQSGKPVHLLGLVSDGGVHSHIDHLLALVQMCAQAGVAPMVHMITDGRDTAPDSALKYLEPLETELAKAGGQIATVLGRFYAMDRDRRWDRTKVAFDALVNGIGKPVESARCGIEAEYADGITDEFLESLLVHGGARIGSGDAVIFFNFRNDRPRQLSEVLAMDEFSAFDRRDFKPVFLTCMTEYDPKLLAPVCFTPENPETTLARTISLAGFKQFHCSETEKYAHVTFFFNGGREEPYAGEVHKLIPSPPVSTYDLQPEMSCEGIADAVVAATAEDYSFIVVNFANGDMVGHTARPHRIIEGLEKMDVQVGRVLDAAVANEYSVVLTADHGNCEEYIDPFTGGPQTQHTCYPVPFMVIDKSFWNLRSNGGLADVAPTILQLMGLHKPSHMNGESMLMEELGPVRAAK